MFLFNDQVNFDYLIFKSFFFDFQIKRIVDRRKHLKVVEERQNVDEFNDLFKEVKWIKKAVNRELSQVKILRFYLNIFFSDVLFTKN